MKKSFEFFHTKNGKKMIIVSVIIISLFAILNVFWGFFYHRYAVLTENIPKIHGVYISKEDEITYSVSKPSYLSFNGNISILDENNNLFLAWPKFNGDYEYAVIVNMTGTTTFLEQYWIWIELNGELSTEKTQESNAQEVWVQNKDIITNLLENAKKMWDLK